MADLKIITVKSNLKDKARVALWEKHPAHPKSQQFPEGGEIFIADDQEHKVAETPAVLGAIREEKLVRAGGFEAVAPAKPDKPAAK